MCAKLNFAYSIKCPLKINEDIRSFCRQGQVQKALEVFQIANNQAIQIEPNSYASLLEVCTKNKALSEGKNIYTGLLSNGYKLDLFLGTKILRMYIVCNSLVDARELFDKMPKRNVLCCNAMLRGYNKNGLWKQTLELYYTILGEGTEPDCFTFPCVIKACTNLCDLVRGREIHTFIVSKGLENDNFVGSALIDMYAKCGRMEFSRQVFEKISSRDVVTWSAMIAGLVQNGYCNEALKCFLQMQSVGVVPDQIIVTSILKACTVLSDIKHGEEIHDYVIRGRYGNDIIVQNCLMDMYTKCGDMEAARHVFESMLERDVISWSSIIAGYSQNGYYEESLKLFRWMILEDVAPNFVTFASVLPSCARLEIVKQGKEIHGYIIRNEFEFTVFVASALIDMYAKCGNVDAARKVFDGISCRDVTLWNSMIASYAQNGHCSEAMELFYCIQREGKKPDSVTVVSILPVISHLSTLGQGKEIHAYVMRNAFECDVSVGNALIDMYAKCGSIRLGQLIFDRMLRKTLVSWNTMIAGHGMHGHAEDALALFYQMQKSGMKPDCVTFIALLSACSHAGLVDKGWQYFEIMNRNYNIIPRMEHYACMVDLLGRSGCLDEALDFIKKMPLKPDFNVWGSLLGACRVHCNTDIAEVAAENIFELRPDNAGYYVVLSNIYAAVGRRADVEKVRAMMRDRGLKKEPGCSWIEVDNRIHSFLVRDKSHPQSDNIYAKLDKLLQQMRAAGYVPDTSFVLHDA
ncbi:hypothetical protein SUGI_0338960 [Cryptomeria japonica]|uniref:pentatricopeptide repeat-containing protein DOT4, chloroplastic n=1 Tax=Cryptomeria japonica TaxID=3369 RepID=UPI002408B940|nr:pentatricopeptide repeat-containing protein DOT4, chloroplastic [Cryptomeria japonica]GLJ18953.1 hypothetical protein SUGI_0338960 [Cryptomeria japonica]